MFEHHIFDNFGVKLLSTRRQINDGVFALLIEEDRHIAKLKISIHQRHTSIFVIEGDRQVDSQSGTTRSSLWTINRYNLAFGGAVAHDGSHVSRNRRNRNLNAF